MGRRIFAALVFILVVLAAVLVPVDREDRGEPDPLPPSVDSGETSFAPVDPLPAPPPPDFSPGFPPVPPGADGPPGRRPPLPPGWCLTLAGRLVDFGGEPISHRRVDIRAATGVIAGAYKAETDGEGRFRFQNLRAGSYIVSHHLRGSWTVERTARVLEGDETICLRMPPGRPLVVRLTDEAGRPVPGAEIRVFDRRGSLMRSPTGPAGTMEFFLTHGFRSVRANRPGVTGKPPLLPASVTRLPPEGQPLVLVLREADSITGRVVLPSGEPVSDVVVTAFEGGEKGEVANTDDDGRFTIPGPRGGVVDLVIDGLMGDPWDRPRREILATGRSQNVRVGVRELGIVLQPAARDRTLKIRLEAPDGRPLPGARVVVRSGAARSRLAVGDGDDRGSVLLTGLPSLPVVLYAEDPWLARRARKSLPPRALRLVPNGQAVVLRFRRGVTIIGNVIDGRGESPGPCELEATEAGEGEVARGKTTGDGWFRLDVPEDVRLPLSIRASRSPQLEVPNRGCLRLDRLDVGGVLIRLDGSY